ncbi:MAG: hypothetical protein GC179_18605 [Anaerolineaceae bacterium]|nr:hypothetical protein [Anaerolineaceae bacterium]
MSEENGKSSTFQSRQDSKQDVPRKPNGIDFKTAYMALIKGYIEVQMKKLVEGELEFSDEAKGKEKGVYE